MSAAAIFIAAMVACWDRSWHAPDFGTLFALWAVGTAVGIILTLRADVGRLVIHRSDWLVAGTTTRFTAIAACVIGAITSFAGAVAVAMALGGVPHLVLASILGSLWMATYPLQPVVWHLVFVQRLVVGVDGVRIGLVTVLFSEIRGARARGRAVEIESTRGHRWIRLLPTWAIADTVVERIRSRLGAPDGGRSPLARAGRPLEAWKRALLSPDYRAAAISTDEAARVLTAGGASKDERLGAALVLARAGEAERVRVVASACVDRRVRVALEQAAADRLDDPTLEAVADERSTTSRLWSRLGSRL